ncbi:MAG: trigger factor [Candidatus Limnocylindria bacterium]
MAEQTPRTPAPPEAAPSATAVEAPDRSFRYSIERRSGSIAALRVEVDAARLAAATDRVFSRRVREARIPGFRPGKAPRALYERTYGTEHLWHEGAEDVVEETYREIVRREDLSPLERPDVTLGPVEPRRPLTYDATVPVRPEVALGDYAAHGATVEPQPVSEEDVERTIAGMREHHAELRPVDRAASASDVLTIDADVTLGGRALPPMARGGHLELGREYPIPGLAEGLVGARAGQERRLDLTFPEDHPDADLRGKTGEFTVGVSQVAEKLLPDLDDEFAKTVGVDDLAALRAAVRDELAHASFHEARDQAAQTVLAHLVETARVEVPEVLVGDELDRLFAELRERVREEGLTVEQFLLRARATEDDLRREWRPAAERRAKSLLVLDAIARAEGVTISGDELAQEVALAPLAAADPASLRDPAVLASLARSMRNRKVVDRLLGLADPAVERELIRKAGGTEAAAPPEIVVPAANAGTAEGREAIRALLDERS